MSRPDRPDAAHWDARYAAGSPWGREPNRTVHELVAGLAPGRARDVAAGDGRHALWLAGNGWRVDALDFSGTAVAQGRAATARLADAGELRGTVHWRVADATLDRPEPLAYDLVLHAYLHLPPPAARTALTLSAGGVAPGGLFLLVGHDRTNLEDGFGGPQDPDVLTDAATVRSAPRGGRARRRARRGPLARGPGRPPAGAGHPRAGPTPRGLSTHGCRPEPGTPPGATGRRRGRTAPRGTEVPLPYTPGGMLESDAAVLPCTTDPGVAVRGTAGRAAVLDRERQPLPVSESCEDI